MVVNATLADSQGLIREPSLGAPPATNGDIGTPTPNRPICAPVRARPG